MPTYVNVSYCDGCGDCVDACPSDIMHIDGKMRRAFNIEPSYCWECLACVKACPQHAIDVRGYADFSPLGHELKVLRDADRGVISWGVRFRNGKTKQFLFPIRTTASGSIRLPTAAFSPEDLKSELLSDEPGRLGVPSLPTVGQKRGQQ